MTEANKARIEFIKDCLNAMNEGNFKQLKEIALATIDRMESQLPVHGVAVLKETLCGCNNPYPRYLPAKEVTKCMNCRKEY